MFAQFLYALPLWLLIILLVGISVLLAELGLLLVRRTIPISELEKNNQFQEFVGGGIRIMYAVLLGFVVVVVWQQYSATRTTVEQEANKLGDILRNAEGYPDPFGREVQQKAKDYAQAVVADEWDALARNETSARTRDAFEELWLLYQSYKPQTSQETALYEEGLRHLSELGEQRRLRLRQARESVPGFLWFVVIGGGIVTIGSSYFLGMRSLGMQMVITAMESGLIALLLLVILSFDHPFVGDLRVIPDAFQREIQTADRLMQQ